MSVIAPRAPRQGDAAGAAGFSPAPRPSRGAFSRPGGSAANVAGFSPAPRHSRGAFSRLGGSAANVAGFSPAPRHSRGAFSRLGGSAARAAGFTLIEVLLATVLLAAGLALAFATLTAATRTAAGGETLAQRSERMRAVEGFLRRRLSSARPVAFGLDENTQLPVRFVGEAGRMRFVADLPDYLGRGGPYLHDLALDDGAGEYAGRAITLDLKMVLAGQSVEEPQPRPPEVLAEGLASAQFRYRSLAEDGRALGEWQDEWTTSDQLPLLVEITLSDADGRDWPPLVVALPMATSVAAPRSGMPEPVTR